MYICDNCYKVFNTPKIVYESHGFTYPPYEKHEACPLCGIPDMFSSYSEDESGEEE